jgi:hypothetical protein
MDAAANNQASNKNKILIFGPVFEFVESKGSGFLSMDGPRVDKVEPVEPMDARPVVVGCTYHLRQGTISIRRERIPNPTDLQWP